MITLALDTSTPLGSVALLRDTALLAETTFQRSAPAENLFSGVKKMLADQKLTPLDVASLAVGVGPGSFTGIRAGIAAAKGLALPRGLPIVAVSSFDALALTALPQLPPDCAQICVLADARRDEVYFAFYNRTGDRAGTIRLGALDQIADGIHDPLWFIGAAIAPFASALAELLGGFATVHREPIAPRAAFIGQLAAHRPAAEWKLEPIYLRAPQYKTILHPHL